MTKPLLQSMLLVFVIILMASRVVFASDRLHIALMVWRGEKEAELGFKDELKALGYTVQYTVKNAGQDRKVLGQLLQRDIVPNLRQFDYIYTFGTTVSRITKAVIKNRVPHVFNVVTDPVGAGIVDSQQSSGGNISGATDRIPVMVHRHQQGELLRNIPVRTVKEPLLVINKTSGERFKLTIPASVVKQAIIIE